MQVLIAEIRAFPGLLVLLIASTYGLDSLCNATQNATCYGALGGPVYLQLMRNTSGHDLSFENEHKIIFRLRRSKTVFYDEFNTPSYLQRWQFVPDNGTLIINPAERRDAGTYRVEIWNKSSGKSVGDHTVQMIIEAPVSVVNLSISCSANGERRVSCSSNGDSPQYSWSVDGRRLNEISTNQSTESQTKTNRSSPDLNTDLRSSTLTLPEGIQGRLTCSARNSISSASETQLLPSCITTPAPPSSTPSHPLTSISMVTNNTLGSDSVIILGAVLGGVLFLCVSMAVICICKKKKKNAPTTTNSYEVEYAEVSFKKRRETEERRKLAETVDYGEVTFRKKGETEERKPLAETVEYGEVTFRKKGETEEKRILAETVDYGEVRLPKPTCNTQQEDSVYAQVRSGQ